MNLKFEQFRKIYKGNKELDDIRIKSFDLFKKKDFPENLILIKNIKTMISIKRHFYVTYLKRYLSQVVSNITLYNCALSNKNEFTNLKVPLRGKSFFKENIEEIYKLGCATIHKDNNFKDFNTYKVETKKLDDVIQNKEISFIKIDVEGHELDVIEGSKKIIKEYKPTLLVEIEEKHTKKPNSYVINEIKNYGYNVFFLENKKIKKIDDEILFDKERNFIFISS